MDKLGFYKSMKDLTCNKQEQEFTHVMSLQQLE